MDHDLLSVDFGFDGTIEAQFPVSRVQRLSVQLGAGDDGLRAIGTGVSDVPITIGAGGGDAVGVLSTEDAGHAGTAPVAISGNDGNDDLSTSVPGAATIDAAQATTVSRAEAAASDRRPSPSAPATTGW